MLAYRNKGGKIIQGNIILCLTRDRSDRQVLAKLALLSKVASVLILCIMILNVHVNVFMCRIESCGSSAIMQR
jgi:hypothetical protein